MPLDLPGLGVTVKLHAQMVVVSHGARMPVYHITRIKERLGVDVILVLPDKSVATRQMYALLDLTRLSKFMIIHIICFSDCLSRRIGRSPSGCWAVGIPTQYLSHLLGSGRNFNGNLWITCLSWSALCRGRGRWVWKKYANRAAAPVAHQ